MTLHIPADELAYKLPADAMYHMIRTLSLGLPPLPDDKPETRTLRDHAIIASISALRPTDHPQAEFAAQFVAASEYWKHCQRLSQLYEATDPKTAAQCRNQAAAMMRQAERSQRALERLQAASTKLYADPQATDAAERTEHLTIVTLAEAIEHMPPPDPAAHIVIAPPAPRPARHSEPPVSKTAEQPRKQQNETPPRQAEPRMTRAKAALIDQFLFGRREPDPNRRYPGESGAQLLMKRRQQETDATAEFPAAAMTLGAELDQFGPR